MVTDQKSTLRKWLDIDSIRADPMPPAFPKEGILQRITPFAFVAILAEASVALPPGPQSAAGLTVSLVLLCLVGGAYFLPWARLPTWCSVFVPLAYVGSVLALELATGQAASGVGIVILSPLIWTALHHRRWESACIVAAVVVVEVVTALIPVQLPWAIFSRRIFFWFVLSTVISLAIHGLRGRAAKSEAEAVAAQLQLQEVALFEARERIASQLNQSTMKRLLALGFHLQGTATYTDHAVITNRIRQAIDEIDETVREMRSAVFELGPELTTQDF